MTAPLGSEYENPPGIRLDPERLDPAWQAPEPPGSGGGVAFLAILAVLMLVFGTTWAGGGFERRRDMVRAYPPGTALDAGSFTLRMERAEARLIPTPSFSDDPPQWEIRAYGIATNTVGEPLTLYQAGVIGLADGSVRGGQDFHPMVRTPDGELDTNKSLKLEPGMTDLPVRIRAELPAEWEPTGHVFVGVREQSYAAHRIDAGFTGKWWSTDRNGRAVGFWVPVQVLPEGPWI